MKLLCCRLSSKPILLLVCCSEVTDCPIMQSPCWQSSGDSGGDTALDSTSSHRGSDPSQDPFPSRRLRLRTKTRPDAATWTMQDPSDSLEADQGTSSPRGRAQPLAGNGMVHGNALKNTLRGCAQPSADNDKAADNAVEEKSSPSSMSFDSMSLAELQACCGKNHGNSITTRKKDIGGLWKTKSKQELILQLKDAATKSSKSVMLQSKMERFLQPLAEKKPSDPK